MFVNKLRLNFFFYEGGCIFQYFIALSLFCVSRKKKDGGEIWFTSATPFPIRLRHTLILWDYFVIYVKPSWYSLKPCVIRSMVLNAQVYTLFFVFRKVKSVLKLIVQYIYVYDWSLKKLFKVICVLIFPEVSFRY